MKQDLKNLFLSQAYADSYAEYEKSLRQSNYPVWDFVVLTSSNEAQAEIFRQQISMRSESGFLPKNTEYIVIPDPDGKRIGSGGATLNAIKFIKENYNVASFNDKKILLIHSGGNSIRIPQYSVCGKLFSPVPRKLSDERRSTVFDEFIITMTAIPSRMVGGMLVLSGDVLLLFNPLQIDFYSDGAAALSFKADLDLGKNHGVFLKDDNGNVSEFLHKQPKEFLIKKGATDINSNINIDTGAVIFSGKLIDSFYDIVREKSSFDFFVNEDVRLNLYSDFVFPFGSNCNIDDYLSQEAEGTNPDEIRLCREKLWEILHGNKMKLILFSHASFIHFGTSHELRQLVVDDIEKYKFLGWSGNVLTNVSADKFSVSNSCISDDSEIESGTYIEDSVILDKSKIGKNCIISCATLIDDTVPDNTVIHCIKLRDGRFVTRMYGVDDNPKKNMLFGKEIPSTLWEYSVFPVRKTAEESVKATLSKDLSGELMSLKESCEEADPTALFEWQKNMKKRVSVGIVYEAVKKNHTPLSEIKEKYHLKFSVKWANLLFDITKNSPFREKIRVYYYISKLYDGDFSYKAEELCFNYLCGHVLKNNLPENIKINKEKMLSKATCSLPVRVNWGGGWSDTPPYCLEQGGKVLNASITFDGNLPVRSVVKRINSPKIVLASTDNGSYREYSDTQSLYDCRNPNDAFTIHKSALIVSGILPIDKQISMNDLLKKTGGGLYIATEVTNIPRGSGLGTSSILASACIKALYEFFGDEADDETVFSSVLCMEQLMSTGGGWQDQVGGVIGGIKLISSPPENRQQISCHRINMSDKALAELEERFCLIYTGQRRLARNLLREIIGKYIGNDTETLHIMSEIQRLAESMSVELEKGDINSFAKLLNEHWEYSKKLDSGCTNACVEQIFLSCEDMIDGRMICGAGGGGFLQVILKKGITAQMLSERLNKVFADSGVEVRNCKFYFN